MNMKRYDWTWDGMGENSYGSWVHYDDAKRAIAQASKLARRAVVLWLLENGHAKAADHLKRTLDGGGFDELRQPQTETTGVNAVVGKWPGDETDAEVEAAMHPPRPDCETGRDDVLTPRKAAAPAPPEPTTALEMVENQLRAYGHDGLYNRAGGCGCKLGDLSPGNCLVRECVAARNDPEKARVEGTDFWLVPARVKP